MDPAGCVQPPFPGPPIRAERSPAPSMVKRGGPPSPPVVRPQLPDSVPLPVREPLGRVGARRRLQASRATRTFRPELGTGRRSAVEPFFSEASFAGRAALEETHGLTVPPARTLPLPAQCAEARLPARPGSGGCCRGAFRLVPEAPPSAGVELRSHRPRLALRSSGGRAPAGFPQPGRTQRGGGGGGPGGFRPQARRPGASETRPSLATRGACGPLGTSPATRSSGARLSQPAGRRGPARGPGRRPPWRSPRPGAGA